MLGRHRDLLINAGSLLATTGVTSALGFAFWTYAAREFSPQAVGFGSAAVSAMSLLGTIGVFGLGTVLIGELPRRKHRGGLVSAALLTSGLGSILLGVGFAVVAPMISRQFRDLLGTSVEAMVFAVGVALTAASSVFDQATIGLLRGGVQLSRNLVFSVVKMAALPVAAVVMHNGFGVGISMSWIAGMGVSLAISAIWLRSRGTPVLPKPDFAILRGLGKMVLAHNWLNLAIVVPVTLFPVLVTVVVSAQANAAFYVAWMITSFLDAVPWHLSTVLFAVAAADPDQVPRKLRFSLKLSLLIGIPVMLALCFAAKFVLGLFGSGYAHEATFTLRLLALAYIPTLPKNFYIAVARAKGYVSQAAILLTSFAVLEMGGVIVCGRYYGLRGVAIAILGATIIEGIVTTPPVLRSAGLYGRYRREFAAAEASRRLRLDERPAACTAVRCNCRTVRDCPVLNFGPATHPQTAGAAQIDALARLNAATPTEAFPMVRPPRPEFDQPTLVFPRVRTDSPHTIPFQYPLIHAGGAPTAPFPIVPAMAPPRADREEHDREEHHTGRGGGQARSSSPDSHSPRRAAKGRGSHRRRS
jgi:O-antigen/teichoic acid export membrane protein